MFLDLSKRDEYTFKLKLQNGEMFEIKTDITFESIDLITEKAEKLGNATINSQTRNKEIDYIDIMNKHNKKIFETLVNSDVVEELKKVLSDDIDQRIKLYNIVVKNYVNGLEQFINELEQDKKEVENVGK